MTIKRLLLFIVSTLLTVSLCAKETHLSEHAQISLITCAPGEEAYEIFGHTGIRILDRENNIDLVYNYGLFDFEQENFLLRFATGKPDYQVGTSTFSRFIRPYTERKSSVSECILNLEPEQRTTIWNYLQWNLKPENIEYRYNFIFNNCSTKPRDIIQHALVGSEVKCPGALNSFSFRQAVEKCSVNKPWLLFGMDICWGSPADRIYTDYESNFLPAYLETNLRKTTVINEAGESRKLVSKYNEIYKANSEKELTRTFFTPTITFYTLLAIILVFSLFAYKRSERMYHFDVILFSLNALFGCLILFLILFSKHPFTNANYNIIWLNPLMGFPLLMYIFPRLRKLNVIFYAAVSITLTLFFVAAFVIEQHFNAAVYPIVLIYLIRSSSHVYHWTYKRRGISVIHNN